MTLHLFRILQELMNNSLRHGKQHQFQFCSNLSTDRTCIYKDNGTGFDTADTNNQSGLGMKKHTK
jgi:signal transduction histidine kinase